MTVMSVPHQVSSSVSGRASDALTREPSNQSRLAPSASERRISNSLPALQPSRFSHFTLDKTSKAPNIPGLSSTTRELIARANSVNIAGIVNTKATLSSLCSINGCLAPAATSLDNANRFPASENMRLTSAILELPLAPSSKINTATTDIAHIGGKLHSQQGGTVNPTLIYDSLQPSEGLASSSPPKLAPKPIIGLPIQPQPSPNKESKKRTPPRGKSSIGARKGKRKRRSRGSDDENIRADESTSEESEDLMTIVTHTKSGRQVHRPALFAPPSLPVSATKSKEPANRGSTENRANVSSAKRRKFYRKGKEQNVTCKHCQRGHSPAMNTIVFCDGCNKAWHRFCHDPPIEQVVIEAKETEWYCSGCRSPQLNPTPLRQALQPASTSDSSKLPLAVSLTNGETLPHIHNQNLDGRIGGRAFTSNERLGYLSTLSHTELVSLLLNIAHQNPDLPVFPPNLRELAKPSRIEPQNELTSSTSLRMNGSGEALMNGLVNLDSTLNPTITTHHGVATSGPAKDANHKRRKGRGDDSDDSGSEYEIEEHRLYPRNGNGFRLPPETEDIDMLLDHPSCPTFSYTLHRRLEINHNIPQLIPA